MSTRINTIYLGINYYYSIIIVIINFDGACRVQETRRGWNEHRNNKINKRNKSLNSHCVIGQYFDTW